MRTTPLLALLLVPTPVLAQDIALSPDTAIEARIDHDLNGDGVDDIAYVAFDDDSRALTVLLSVKHEFDIEFARESLALELTMLGSASLAVEGNVLVFEDLTGGTTAYASTRRFRYDARRKRMRLIGMDSTLYSRTYAHDGFYASWNLLNGDTVTRELRLNRSGGDAAYDQVRERRFKRRIRPQFLSDSPDPETMLEEMRQG